MMNKLQAPLTIRDRFSWLRPWARSPAPADFAAVRQIRAMVHRYEQLGTAELRRNVEQLQQQVRDGVSPACAKILCPGTALVVVAVHRALGLSLYDEQLLAGITLARQAIAEMQTGEGKTLGAAVPTFLHALAGRGVHIMTVNAYLAERDYNLLSPVFDVLGLSAGLLRPEATPQEKRTAYECHVTYGPGYEFGFDYLRDQMSHRAVERRELGDAYRRQMQGDKSEGSAVVQRGFGFAVIDEVDCVLLDEASCPLVLSDAVIGPAPNAAAYLLAKTLADDLQAEADFRVDYLAGTISLTEQGTARAQSTSKQAAQHRLDRPWQRYLEQALRAQHLLHRDVDYVVKNGQVMLVDQHTGRIFADRSWSNGLHQAVQAKESCTILAESTPAVRISRQRFFRLYEGIAGLTGTASASRQELRQTYGLPVVTIPLRRPCLREELPTRYFVDQDSKIAAIVNDIKTVHAQRRPILVGTRTIGASEALAGRLQDNNLLYELLNGKQDADEADLISRAGRLGAITIATNMAGRGTDIKLGPGVARLGGLHVIGTERHESSRVDRQLAGRAGRQGDPGSCRFYVAADDPLVLEHGPELASRMKRASSADGEIYADFAALVGQAQRKAEELQRLKRKQLYVADDWLEGALAKLHSLQ